VKRGTFILLLGVVVALLVAFWPKVMHALGWDGQTSDYYAAWSSSIPALIALLGMSTLITGLWHGLNCHERGCWRLGKHKVGGTPWCSRHHEGARPEMSERELLLSIEEHMATLVEIFRPPQDTDLRAHTDEL
jgi:hypothetical protein